MSFVSHLQQEYVNRREKNGSYSLRAYARDLGISHTYLSLIFAGKRRLSASQTAQIGMLLGYSAREVQTWIEQRIHSQTGNRGINPTLKKSLRKKRNSLPTYEDLQIEYSRVMGGWYYLPILEATYLTDATQDPKWFAARLGITSIEARDAIERLVNLEMLEVVDGKLRKTKDFVRMPTQRPLSSMRAYYLAVLEKVKEQLLDSSEAAFQARLISGGTLAIKASRIEQARERLKQLQDEFIAEFAEADSDEVYQFNLQFFPITQPRPTKGNRK